MNRGMIKRLMTVGLAGLLVMAALMGVGGCSGMTIGDKAKVERYLEEKYGGEFEVIVPDGAPEVLRDGVILSFPVYAYNTADPQLTFEVSKKEDGKGYEDMYRVALVDRQAKRIVDAALLEAGLEAVSDVYCFFDDVELAKVQEALETDFLEYLSKAETPVLEMLFYIAIAESEPTLQELETKLTRAFALVDERMFGKEAPSYTFALVEADDFNAFCEEVAEYGIDSYPAFRTATVINYLYAGDGGSFTHEGYRRPLSDSLAILLGEAPPWYERDE